MRLDLNHDGNPQSGFILACAGRRINLACPESGPHPLQLIPSQWRALAISLNQFATELATVESSIEPEGDVLLRLFRRLIYDATELFDSYAALLPSRLSHLDKEGKKAVKEYEVIAKRLRSDCAQLCNRCKHQGAQIGFLWARSPSNGATGSRFLVTTYNSRSGLLRDDKIHKGAQAGIGLVRWSQQVCHNLLRLDLAAGRLIEKLPDSDCKMIPDLPASLPVGEAMRNVAIIRGTRHADEPAFHDGLSFSDEVVLLTRVRAQDFGPSAVITAKLLIEAGTTEYSVS